MQNVFTANTHTRKSCVFHQQALVSLTPYSPRTLRTSLPIHHALCPPPSLSSAAQSTPLLFHSPTLTLRQTMRRSRSAAQVAHNEKCRMQKKKRSGNWNRNEWHVKHSEPSPKNLRSSFLSFCSVCVCFAFVLSSYWQFYFVQIYAALCSADLSKHTDTHTHTLTTSRRRQQWLWRRLRLFVYTFFQWNVCSSSKKLCRSVAASVLLQNSPYYYTQTHTRKQMNTHSLELRVLLSLSRALSYCRSNKLLSAMQTHHSLTHTGAYVLRGE